MIRVLNDVYKDKDIKSTYLERMDKNNDYIIRRALKNYPQDVSGIAAVEIETLNRCNNDCSFCPVNRKIDAREYCRMTDALFYKIIDELAAINYCGEISIFSNNEPLLDTRIYDFIDYAKKNLPNAHHSLYTNGMLLDEEKFDRLTKSLDVLYIDNYDDDMHIMENVQKIINNYKDKSLVCDVLVLMRKKNQILDSRGGSAPNRVMEKFYTSTCIAPFMQLIVRPDGKISRCCQDPLGKTTLGDLSKQTIQEVWEGEPFSNLRSGLQQGLRTKIQQCQYCDIFGNVVYTRKDWKSRLIQTIMEIVWEKKIYEHRNIYIYGKKYQSYDLLNILSVHGVEISGFINEKRDERLTDCRNYILFPGIDCDVLDLIDLSICRAGKDYLICDILLEMVNRQINSEYRLEKKVIKDLMKLKGCRRMRTYFFGTGKVAKELISLLDYNDSDYIGFLDNDEKKWGSNFLEKQIISPMELKKENTDSLIVIIASSYCDEIMCQLLEEELCEEKNIINGYSLLKTYHCL